MPDAVKRKGGCLLNAKPTNVSYIYIKESTSITIAFMNQSLIRVVEFLVATMDSWIEYVIYSTLASIGFVGLGVLQIISESVAITCVAILGLPLIGFTTLMLVYMSLNTKYYMEQCNYEERTTRRL